MDTKKKMGIRFFGMSICSPDAVDWSKNNVGRGTPNPIMSPNRRLIVTYS
jgi:hypothetical protein